MPTHKCARTDAPPLVPPVQRPSRDEHVAGDLHDDSYPDSVQQRRSRRTGRYVKND